MANQAELTIDSATYTDNNHVIFAFNLKDTRSIQLVNIFYNNSVYKLPQTKNQENIPFVAKANEDVKFNLLLYKDTTDPSNVTNAYEIKGVKLENSVISGMITFIGDAAQLLTYAETPLITANKGMQEIYGSLAGYLKGEAGQSTYNPDGDAPVKQLFDLIAKKDPNPESISRKTGIEEVYQTLYKPIVFKINSLSIQLINRLKTYEYRRYPELNMENSTQFKDVLDRFIKLAYVTFTNDDIDRDRLTRLINAINIENKPDFIKRITKDRENYNTYLSPNADTNIHHVMYITNFLELIRGLSNNQDFLLSSNRSVYYNFELAIYRNMATIFTSIKYIHENFSENIMHSVRKVESNDYKQLDAVLNDMMNEESSNNIIIYLKLNNTETVTDSNGNIDHYKKSRLYNQRFSISLNQEISYDTESSTLKSTLLKLGYNDDEFQYYTCKANKASVENDDMIVLAEANRNKNRQNKFTLPTSGNGITSIDKYKYEYYFGKFQEVFPVYEPQRSQASSEPRPISNEEISRRMKAVETQLATGKPVFVIGYGASGAGKTSSLINYNGEDGILIHLCKQMIKTKINKQDIARLGVTVYEYYVNEDTIASAEHKFDVSNPESAEATFTYVSDGDGETVLPLNHKYRGQYADSTQFTLNANTKLGELLVHLVDTDRLVKATTNNPQSSRSHVLVFVKFYNNEEVIGNLIVGDFAGVENKFRCDDTITLKKFLDMPGPGKDGRPFYSMLLSYKKDEAATDTTNELIPKAQIDPDKDVSGITANSRVQLDNMICTIDSIASTEKMYDFTPSNLIYRGTFPATLSSLKPKIITDRPDEIQRQDAVKPIPFKNKQYIEDEKARKRIEIALTQLIPSYPGTIQDTKQMYDYLVTPAAKADITAHWSTLKDNFKQIEAVRGLSTEDPNYRRQRLVTYLVVKHILFYQGVSIDNLDDTMNKYLATMKSIQSAFRDPKNHAETSTTDFSNIKLVSNLVLNVKPEYPYNSQYKTALIDINKKTAVRNKVLYTSAKPPSTFHQFSYIPNPGDPFGNTYKKSFNGIFNGYNFKMENVSTIISFMTMEFKSYYETYNKTPQNIASMTFQPHNFLGMHESLDSMPTPKIPVWIQGNIKQFAKLFMDNEFAMFKEFLTTLGYREPTEQLCFILDVLDKTSTDIDKFNGLVEYMATVIDETICRLEHAKFICDRRVDEGAYINATLSNIRNTIKKILFKKHEISTAIMHSPNIIDMCLKSYCPAQQNCFAVKNPDEILDRTYSVNLIDEIYRKIHSTNENPPDNFYKDITICLFGVFNISRCANNPPPIQYIDINRLKQIESFKEEQDKIPIMPVLTKLKNDIERFKMNYLASYDYLVNILIPKVDTEPILVNNIRIKAPYLFTEANRSFGMRNPNQIYTGISFDVPFPFRSKQTNFRPILIGYSRDKDTDIIVDKIDTYGEPKTIKRSQILYGPDENKIVTYLVDPSQTKDTVKLVNLKPTDYAHAKVIESRNSITYSSMTLENSLYSIRSGTQKTIKEIITDIIREIDISNAASAVGVLEFLDQMSKFSSTNTLCYSEGDKYDLVNKDDIDDIERRLYRYGKPIEN